LPERPLALCSLLALSHVFLFKLSSLYPSAVNIWGFAPFFNINQVGKIRKKKI
jgi:hypothetical protein